MILCRIITISNYVVYYASSAPVGPPSRLRLSIFPNDTYISWDPPAIRTGIITEYVFTYSATRLLQAGQTERPGTISSLLQNEERLSGASRGLSIKTIPYAQYNITGQAFTAAGGGPVLQLDPIITPESGKLE